MKVLLTGQITTYRPYLLKGVTLGQIDLLQYGDYRYPSKVLSVIIPDQNMCRTILETMMQSVQLYISFIAWVVAKKDELEISVLEVVQIKELSGGVVIDDGRTSDRVDPTGPADQFEIGSTESDLREVESSFTHS